MNAFTRLANTTARRLDVMFPGFFQGAKHNHYRDFGFPETLEFSNLFAMYQRNGMARAGVDKTVLKTWQSYPFLQEYARDGSEKKKREETKLEGDLRQRFADLRIWQRLANADRRSLVGGYSGAILRLADTKPFDQPVDRVPGGLDGLVEIIPAWAGQLEVSQWDQDETSETYGQPTMFRFNEASMDQRKGGQARSFTLHPDRVVIWSDDGTIHNHSLLEPGYNDLITMEKISGAGGEGFWKNAKSAPVFEIDKEMNLQDMARAMGVPSDEIADKMDEQVADWQKGFDQLLMLQGMTAKTLGVVLPSPEHFYSVALQSFAASISCPTKILVGMQTGKRASTEDAEEWAQTNMSRRNGSVVPNIMTVVNRLERFGIIPERDWALDWENLMDPGPGEMLDRAGKMADVNQKMQAGGELVFTPEEIRYETGREPLSEDDKYRDQVDKEDYQAALGLPAD